MKTGVDSLQDRQVIEGKGPTPMPPEYPLTSASARPHRRAIRLGPAAAGLFIINMRTYLSRTKYLIRGIRVRRGRRAGVVVAFDAAALGIEGGPGVGGGGVEAAAHVHLVGACADVAGGEGSASGVADVGEGGAGA